ncbi:hypothetical protein HA402_005474 [Bradysia odoriphaga]|nr:hypothetical protein HA402_005474 [Bradysia odoriphaga]
MLKILMREKAKLINQWREKAKVAISYDNYADSIVAINIYTEAISIDESNYELYSDRSDAYLKVCKYEEALQDANKSIELNPIWVKGYLLKGSALSFMQKYREALSAYKEGLKQDPKNAALLQGLAEAKQSLLSMYSTHMDIDPKSPTEKDVRLTKFQKLTILGNNAFYKNDFNTALKHYNEAMENNSTDIQLYINISAVYFEQKDYEKCISWCKMGIVIGGENGASVKLIANAFSIIGEAYKTMEKWTTAMLYVEKSNAEHFPEVETILSQIDRKIKEEELNTYIDPIKAEEEKKLGNNFFLKGEFIAAAEHYSKAMKLNTKDQELHSYRTRCYLKIVALDMAVYLKSVDIDRMKRKPFTAIHKRRGIRL